MKLELMYGTTNIVFNVIFRNRKTMEVAVEAPNNVTVIAPIGAKEDEILKKVESKGSWIIQKIYSFKHMQYRHIEREFVSGESFMYLGRNYSLQIELDLNVKKPEVKLYRGKFIVKASNKNGEHIRNAMEQWYRDKSKNVVASRIKYYQRFFNKEPTGIKIKEQKKRWGSCTSKNGLLFNWRCVMAPSNILDYIVVHEMCHMYFKNHSKKFWSMLSEIIPDYELRKIWLRNNGIKFDL